MITYIEEICEAVPCIKPETKSLEVHTIFTNHPSLQGIVVSKDEKPVALVMRNLFYQKLGGLYGYDLFMGRPINLLMNTSPLIVEGTQTIENVSQLAMERTEEELYDYVIVTKNNKYKGIVSIQHLLLTLAKIQRETAWFMNPLTGLPGNNLIDKELANLLNLKSFSVLYIDLDHFKTYNDTYGFKRGDDLILATAKILTRNLAGHFIGHIGGDDFVAFLNNHEYEKVSNQIIIEFNCELQSFYSEEHWKQKYVLAENRSGNKERIPLVSLSIAVVTNQVQSFTTTEAIVHEAMKMKKACKKNHFSCFIVNNYECSCVLT